jgi:hypothetical protein
MLAVLAIELRPTPKRLLLVFYSNVQSGFFFRLLREGGLLWAVGTRISALAAQSLNNDVSKSMRSATRRADRLNA